MSETIAREGLESLGRFYGIYRGLVSEDTDPEERGRIGVSVPGVCTRTVWANPRNQEGSLGSGFKWLSPRKGQVVWVEYMYGDPLNPIWSYHGWALRECPSELSSKSRFGFVTPRGNKLIIDEDEGSLELSISDTEDPSTVANLKMNKGKVYLNGESEGIPLASKLIEEINKLQKEINDIKQSFGQSGLATSMITFFPNATQLAAWSITPPLDITEQSTIENKNLIQ